MLGLAHGIGSALVLLSPLQPASGLVFPSRRHENKAVMAVTVTAGRGQQQQAAAAQHGQPGGGSQQDSRQYTFTFCLERVERGPYKVRIGEEGWFGQGPKPGIAFPSMRAPHPCWLPRLPGAIRPAARLYQGSRGKQASWHKALGALPPPPLHLPPKGCAHWRCVTQGCWLTVGVRDGDYASV